MVRSSSSDGTHIPEGLEQYGGWPVECPRLSGTTTTIHEPTASAAAGRHLARLQISWPRGSSQSQPRLQIVEGHNHRQSVVDVLLSKLRGFVGNDSLSRDPIEIGLPT